MAVARTVHHLNSRPRLAMAVTIVLALASTAFYWLLPLTPSRSNENPDNKLQYVPIAESIASGNGIVNADGSPALIYPPGYSLYRASVLVVSQTLNTSAQTLLTIADLVCVAFSAALLFLIARTAYGAASAVLAGSAFFSYPHVGWMTAQPQSETVYLPFFLATVLCVLYLPALRLTRRGLAIAALGGVAAGLSMLIRPISIGMFLVAGAYLAVLGWRSRSFRVPLLYATTLTVCAALTALPWQRHVSRLAPIPSLLGTNGPSSITDGLSYARTFTPSSSVRPIPEPPAAAMKLMLELAAVRDGIKDTRGIAAFLRNQAQQNPTGLAQVLGLKVIRAWYGTNSGRFELMNLLVQLVFVPLLVVAHWKERKRSSATTNLVVMSTLTILYFWAMTLVGMSIVRYMVPGLSIAFVMLGGFAGNTLCNVLGDRDAGMPRVRRQT